jgi:hypothetical protein
LCPPSLLSMFWKLTHIMACIRTSLLWLNNFPFMDIPCFINNQLMDIWVSAFWLLWIVLLWTFFTSFCLGTCFQFFWIYIQGWNFGLYDKSILKLLRNWQTVFHSGCYPILYSPSNVWRLQSLHILANTCYFPPKEL